MRHHGIIFGIFIIFSISAFALAAPVPVQEKRDECVDMVRLPKDEMAVLGKRGLEDEQLLRLLNQLDRYIGPPEPVKLTDEHALSSSALPSSDHGPHTLSGSAPAGPGHGPHAPSSSAPARPERGSMNGVQAPVKNPRPSIDPDSSNRIYRTSFDFPLPPKRQKLVSSSKEFGQGNLNQAVQPNPRPLILGTWNPVSYNTRLPTQPNYLVTVSSPNPRPLNLGTWNTGPYNTRLPTQPNYWVTAPSPNPRPLNPGLPNLGWSKEHVQPNSGPLNSGMWNQRPYNPRLPTRPTQPQYGVAAVPSPNLDPGWLEEHRQQPNPRPLNQGTPGLRLPKGPIMLNFETHPATDPKGKAKETRRHIPGIARAAEQVRMRPGHRGRCSLCEGNGCESGCG